MEKPKSSFLLTNIVVCGESAFAGAWKDFAVKKFINGLRDRDSKALKAPYFQFMSGFGDLLAIEFDAVGNRFTAHSSLEGLEWPELPEDSIRAGSGHDEFLNAFEQFVTCPAVWFHFEPYDGGQVALRKHHDRLEVFGTRLPTASLIHGSGVKTVEKEDPINL